MLKRHVLFLGIVAALLVGCAGSASSGKGTPGVISSNLLQVFSGESDLPRILERARRAGIRTDQFGVLVDIQTRGLEPGDRERFQRDGARIRNFSAEYQRVSASIASLPALRELAALEPVRLIAPEYGTVDRP
jgi:hypothetical protein